MAQTTVLIATQPGDLHAYAVEHALREKGGSPILWHTTQFPSIDGEAIYLGSGNPKVEIEGPHTNVHAWLSAGSIKTVWCRRPGFTVNEEEVHPSDLRFAERNCQDFRQALFEMLAPDAFWVNSHAGRWRSRNKILQQRVAIDSGLATPESLYTNDPQRIRAFIRRHGGLIAFKPLYGLPWKSDEFVWMPYTQELREDQLVEDALLRAAPGIYQELVPKAFELRVTIMGNSIFAARIDSQRTERGRVDWRRANDALCMEPYELPGHMAQRSLHFMRRLGLVFGCLDFIVTPKDQFVFLEVNQMGQFLFVELETGLPLVDAFAEFLLAGSGEFRWNSLPRDFDYRQMREDVLNRANSEASRFFPVPEPYWRE